LFAQLAADFTTDHIDRRALGDLKEPGDKDGIRLHSTGIAGEVEEGLEFFPTPIANFDTGVAHALSGTQTLDRNSDLYGRSFEQWIAMELRAYLSYRRHPEELGYWRSTADHEVDFILGDRIGIEAKATRKVGASDLRGLGALAEEKIVRQLFLVSEDPIETKRGSIRCLPWRTFLEELWGDKLL